jgi:dCTP deaminase
VILTDREIKIAIEEEFITIDPRPEARAFSSTSVDLTLDPALSEFKRPTAGIEQVIDPALEGFDHEHVLTQFTEKRTIDEQGYVFRPGQLVLAWTREFVDLKTRAKLAARVEGKSSLARLGLAVHITAPTIHAGFRGRIRLEMINHGPMPIKLRQGMRICQLIFEQTQGTPDLGYQGRFSGQDAKRRG